MRCGWVSSGVAADSDIRKVLRKGQWQLGIFELQNSGKLITGSGLFHLTSAFRISNSWIWSLQQLMAVRRQRLRLDTMCWSAASSTLGCKVWSCAVQMLEDMQLAALQLDLRCVSPHGIWQRAWHSLFEVRLLGLQCDVVAMNAHLAAGNWEKTNGLLYHMRVSELYPDAVTRESPQMLRDQIAVGSVLTTLAKGARWQLALALIKDVKASSLQPDTVSIQLVVQSCEKASLWGAAVELMSRQVESVSSVMKAAQQALCWQVASQMLQLMKDSDIRADVVCYNCLMGPPPRQWPYVLMILAGACSSACCPDEIDLRFARQGCEIHRLQSELSRQRLGSCFQLVCGVDVDVPADVVAKRGNPETMLGLAKVDMIALRKSVDLSKASMRSSPAVPGGRGVDDHAQFRGLEDNFP
ncbi:unnamed protein product [Cladocopium goreaui]|uniref:Pentacotripeptide-repeat region of PRORP domain-containing protein n=1 Tax=Cladocopium goreaui TaxID=2562237 RepID=A0A9P1C506_9DINO|nr:unnamed protein product [Cladocopium goreaui]